MSPQNRPLTYSYSAAQAHQRHQHHGHILFDGCADRTCAITCNVVDDKGQTATANTEVTIVAPIIPKQKVR